MNAEIITIGDELLLGQVIDTNSAWMGLALADAGVTVTRRTAVGDEKSAITNALREAVTRVKLVLLTGGLGPTKDDITKDTLREFFQCGWREDAEVMAHLQRIFESRGRKLLDINRQQAMLPDKCVTLFNETGTAPGMLFVENGFAVVSMPGVPGEMKHLMEKKVLPWLPTQFELPVILHRTMLTAGIPESLLAQNLEHLENAMPDYIKLAYLPAFNSIRLRITGSHPDRAHLENEIQLLYDQIAAVCGEFLVAKADTTIPAAVAEMLLSRNISISLAESCTGGFVTNQLIKQPGISAVMKGGLVSYSNEIKMQELGVDPNILQTVGAVSEACAQAMVEGIRDKFHADVAISTTGIAGPGGATDEKPVGLVFIGVSGMGKTVVKKFHFPGSREQFMERTSNAALDLLRKEILAF